MNQASHAPPLEIEEALRAVLPSPEFELRRPYARSRGWLVIYREGRRVADVCRGRVWRLAQKPGDYSGLLQEGPNVPRAFRVQALALVIAHALGIRGRAVSQVFPYEDRSLEAALGRHCPEAELRLMLNHQPRVAVIVDGLEIAAIAIDGTQVRVADATAGAMVGTWQPRATLWRINFAKACGAYVAAIRSAA